jgi:hypothetical protein
MTMVRTNWRLCLPLAQILLAIGLALTGRGQTQRETSGKFQTWDYIAPAEMLLHSINYPAAVATGFTVRRRSFQIGLEYSAGAFLVYLAYIALLWVAVAWCIGKSRTSAAGAHRVSIWLSLAGIVSGGLLLVTAFGMLRGPYGLLLVLAAFLWSAAFLATSSTLLARRVRARS